MIAMVVVVVRVRSTEKEREGDYKLLLWGRRCLHPSLSRAATINRLSSCLFDFRVSHSVSGAAVGEMGGRGENEALTSGGKQGQRLPPRVHSLTLYLFIAIPVYSHRPAVPLCILTVTIIVTIIVVIVRPFLCLCLHRLPPPSSSFLRLLPLRLDLGQIGLHRLACALELGSGGGGNRNQFGLVHPHTQGLHMCVCVCVYVCVCVCV